MDAEDKYNSMLRMIEARLNPESNTVLIVDDEMGIRRFVARGIRKLDPNIVMYEASNGKEAIDTLAKIRKTHSKEPVMIVTDLNMPVMDGWEFIEHLRKDAHHGYFHRRFSSISSPTANGPRCGDHSDRR